MYKTIICVLFALSFFIDAMASGRQIDPAKTNQKAKQALLYCKRKGYNTRYCILIDMSLPSGTKRFMVWDFTKQNILLSGLISHGCGRSPWSGVWNKDHPSFSNRDGSHCTALGKYQINDRSYSAWGIHVKYFLTGLDTSNNNALVRQVVFHSWEKVPEKEVYPDGTPEGWGCPAISNNVMKQVDAMLRKQKKHVLMWIYS
ncbi:murein L,D-transpeptidase catalytic domain-containing protein [Mucilaginibacter paludis]|uniref:Peptidase n=1 Tax=Mucilaginibacter paludis DSM 18603 TaxID=714943 RepID=H1YAC2_9SPHI|nr:murein L,D-transpeptidase catalytic domain family protein [Mucilaginibacter paludis]EHQ26965.1 hypothetical protein Mucpa_2854 [Mucilaginibacter paludis DSM 18603]